MQCTLGLFGSVASIASFIMLCGNIYEFDFQISSSLFSNLRIFSRGSFPSAKITRNFSFRCNRTYQFLPPAEITYVFFSSAKIDFVKSNCDPKEPEKKVKQGKRYSWQLKIE